MKVIKLINLINSKDIDKAIRGSDPIYKTNKAMEVPAKLYAKDGREFLIQSWATYVSIDENVRVTIEAVVILPEVT